MFPYLSSVWAKYMCISYIIWLVVNCYSAAIIMAWLVSIWVTGWFFNLKEKNQDESVRFWNPFVYINWMVNFAVCSLCSYCSIYVNSLLLHLTPAILIGTNFYSQLVIQIAPYTCKEREEQTPYPSSLPSPIPSLSLKDQNNSLKWNKTNI